MFVTNADFAGFSADVLPGVETQVLDSSLGTFVSSCSLTLDSNDNPHAVFCDYSSTIIKHVWWNGSTWTYQNVTLASRIAYVSLALDSKDNPYISYCDNTNHTLKYAVWNSTNWVIITVDYAGYAVEYTNPRPMGLTSLALDGNNLARISYFDESSYHLKYFAANTSFAKADPPLDQSTDATSSSSENSPADSPSNQSSSAPPGDPPSTLPSSPSGPNSQPDPPNEPDPEKTPFSALIAVIATAITLGALASTTTALFLRKRKH